MWHDSVRYYELKRPDGTLIGSFFTDLFARPNKRGGAWMGGCVSRAKLNGQSQAPIAYLVCNFNAPAADKPSLLTHTEVITLFHEFGHTLHHLLTEVDYPSLAGTNGVAWDAVELPSQFLENFTWRPEVLRDIGRHFETGEPLPRRQDRDVESLADLPRRARDGAADRVRAVRLPAARRVHAGARLARARRCSTRSGARSPSSSRRPTTASRTRSATSSAARYAAGYYSYKWAEVLSADAFAAFEEAGVFDRATAERFRRAVLATGGSRNALDAFIEFRGRPPDLDPLLKQAGIATRQ